MAAIDSCLKPTCVDVILERGSRSLIVHHQFEELGLIDGEPQEGQAHAFERWIQGKACAYSLLEQTAGFGADGLQYAFHGAKFRENGINAATQCRGKTSGCKCGNAAFSHDVNSSSEYFFFRYACWSCHNKTTVPLLSDAKVRKSHTNSVCFENKMSQSP